MFLRTRSTEFHPFHFLHDDGRVTPSCCNAFNTNLVRAIGSSYHRRGHFPRA